jgi:hypothetical protein
LWLCHGFAFQSRHLILAYLRRVDGAIRQSIAVIPGRERCERARNPERHLWAWPWIPGPALRAVPE